jgi:membrane associated rhomboid family serine protease
MIESSNINDNGSASPWLTQGSKILIAATLLLSAMFWLVPSEGARPWLALYPGLVQPPTLRVWTLATFALYHENVVELLVSLALLAAVGWHVEPVWGTHELLRFVAIVVVASGLATCVAAYVLHTVTPTWLASFHDQILFDAPIHGASPVLAAFAVVGKQLFPEHSINDFLSLRLKTMPALLGSLYITGALLGFHVMRLVPTLSGLVVAWIYLRFVQISPSTGLKGDASDHFSFASFFPEALRPFVARLTGAQQQQQQRSILPLTSGRVSAASTILAVSSLPTNAANNDTDRRRQLAQFALDQRLAEKRAQH